MLTPPGAALAILFAAGEPLAKKQLAGLLEIKERELEPVLAALRKSVEIAGLALIETGEEVELRTSPEAAPLVKKLWESERSRDLGKAGLETLATIAYQAGEAGVTRSEIDWVRGVNSSASVRTLLLRGLIEGREDPADRRRMRYALTTEALAHLGISKRSSLPRYEELARGAGEAIAAGEADVSRETP
ncbi:MAG: SMC-Scp complex subunit ScpB [Patescibacteria group bacterium]|nr:SMC-Scp complex subunit ScpB [Patescibacteria group bacterium]MDE1945017.1 SMC-Scp complex subunit ScpB [Patescibacteria group bacterium]MDE2057523.1 SMC-Scp complex subunit ScpB [Patescibacteria group bacterium]